MKSFIKKIAKPIAIGVFFMALFFNVKVSLEDPFVSLDNAALAQSDTSSGGRCFIRTTSDCPSIGGTGGGQRVTCDKSGTYVSGETCTRVLCVTGATEQEVCTQNP
jgi:hypothetical protein